MTHWVIGPCVNVALFGSGMIDARQQPVIASAIHHIIIGWINRNMPALTTCGRLIALANRKTIGAVGNALCGIVLLRTINAIWKMIVGYHTVKLCGGLIVIGSPILTSIKRNLRAPIIGNDHPLVVLRRNP